MEADFTIWPPIIDRDVTLVIVKPQELVAHTVIVISICRTHLWHFQSDLVAF